MNAEEHGQNISVFLRVYRWPKLRTAYLGETRWRTPMERTVVGCPDRRTVPRPVCRSDENEGKRAVNSLDRRGMPVGPGLQELRRARRFQGRRMHGRRRHARWGPQRIRWMAGQHQQQREHRAPADRPQSELPCHHHELNTVSSIMEPCGLAAWHSSFLSPPPSPKT